jgi:hypothetical protein
MRNSKLPSLAGIAEYAIFVPVHDVKENLSILLRKVAANILAAIARARGDTEHSVGISSRVACEAKFGSVDGTVCYFGVWP